MITKIVASAFALASVLNFAGPAFAQDHMIDGTTRSKPFRQMRRAPGCGVR